MKIILLLFLGVLFLALQTTVLQALPEWIGTPDLFFLLIIFLALHCKTVPGAVLTLLLTIGLEVFSGYFLGLYTIAYLLVFSIIKWLCVRFTLTEVTQQPALVALAYLFVNAFVYLSSLMLADVSPAPWGWGNILQRVLIVTILAIPLNRCLCSLMIWCDQRKRHRTFFHRKKGNQYKARV